MKEGGQRIHLIFDYVDEGYQLPERITLKSGDIVHQTRRSIDLASDCVNYKPENCTPRFIVIGAQVSEYPGSPICPDFPLTTLSI